MDIVGRTGSGGRTATSRTRRWHLAALALLVGFGASGCGTVADSTGEAIAHDLKAAFPEQIVTVSFENHPPLDPPTLWIDLAPPLGPEQQLRFLCDDIQPRVDAVDGRITAIVTHGWESGDCDGWPAN